MKNEQHAAIQVRSDSYTLTDAVLNGLVIEYGTKPKLKELYAGMDADILYVPVSQLKRILRNK